MTTDKTHQKPSTEVKGMPEVKAFQSFIDTLEDSKSKDPLNELFANIKLALTKKVNQRIQLKELIKKQEGIIAGMKAELSRRADQRNGIRGELLDKEVQIDQLRRIADDHLIHQKRLSQLVKFSLSHPAYKNLFVDFTQWLSEGGENHD